MKIFTYVGKYVKRYKKVFGLFLVSSVVLWLSSTLTPYISGLYLDYLLSKQSMKYVYGFTGLFLGVNLITIFSRYIMSLYVTKLNNNITFEMNYDIFERFRYFKILELEKKNTAYIMDRINQDLSVLVVFFSDKIVNIATSFFTIVVSFVILYRIDKYILLFQIMVIPIYVLLYRLFRKKLYDANYELAENTSTYFAKRTEQISFMSFIKTNVLFPEMNHELRHSFDKIYGSIMKQVKVNYLFNNMNSILLAFSYVVIIFWGGVKVINGQLSIGNYTIINTYFNLVMDSINYFMALANDYQRAVVSHDRIEEFMGYDKEPNGEVKLDQVNSITLKNLSVSYDGKRQLFKDFNLELKKGSVYCIKGGNGAGKSTLINIILGMYHDIYKGEVLYNDKSISELDMYSIRRNSISVVEQEPELLNMSILDYLTIGIDGRSRQELKEQAIKFAKSLKLYDTIQKLPNQLESTIEEGASNFSGGEKQKLAIIRALLKEADVLIFDEPTSALDIESIEVFSQLIQTIKKGKIIMMITHDKRIFDISDYDVEF